MIGEQVGMRFQTDGKCGQGWNLMGLGMDGNR